MSFFEEELKRSRIFDVPDEDEHIAAALAAAAPTTTKQSAKAISKNCIDLVKRCEGCKLTAYQDSVGVWTIGYGRTTGVIKGQVITQKQADDYLLQELGEFCKAVLSLVKVPVNQNQLDALVCFTYNVGVGNFKSSTMLKLINAGDLLAAADQFPRWNKAGGKVLAGLTKRRELEKQLFIS